LRRIVTTSGTTTASSAAVSYRQPPTEKVGTGQECQPSIAVTRGHCRPPTRGQGVHYELGQHSVR
jgi:hypothetical protein